MFAMLQVYVEIFFCFSGIFATLQSTQYIKIEENFSIDETIVPIHQQVVSSSTECFLLCQQKQCFISQITTDVSGKTLCSLHQPIEDLSSKLVSQNGSEIFNLDIHQAQDCMTHYENGHTRNGVYEIYIEGKHVKVFCEMATPHGPGWTTFQRRFDGSIEFNKNWAEYSNGFGDASGEYWLGLQHIHQFTKTQPVELLIYGKRFNGLENYAKYENFTLGDEASGFKLMVSDPSSQDLDDAALLAHNGMKFSTFDNDNDLTSSNCANVFKAGWWFAACFLSGMNLNGQFPYDGDIDYDAYSLHWDHFSGLNEALPEVKMMFRKKT